MLHRVDSLFESGIPIVFHGVVGSSHEFLTDETPFLVALVSENEEDPLFFLGPFCSLDLGVEVVEPPFTARFARPAVKSIGQVAPHHMLIALAFFVDILEDDLIFVDSPVSDRISAGFL